MGYMVRIEKLCKKYGDHVIFNDFDMTVNDGEFIAVTGNSGCGKTTLLNMIGAIEPFDSGSIIADEYNLSNKKIHLDYYREYVGFLFQNFALIENKTVKENLEIVKKEYRNNFSFDDVLEKVGIPDKINEKIYKLSGGEQQRVALARLMIKKCRLVLADEPTGSLDTHNRDEVFDILREINSDLSATVIVVTHDPELAGRCHRQIVL